jgi:hypothetical protein
VPCLEDSEKLKNCQFIGIDIYIIPEASLKTARPPPPKIAMLQEAAFIAGYGEW